MEKGSALPLCKKRDATPSLRRTTGRRWFGPDDIVFYIVIILVGTTIWFTEIAPWFGQRQHGCTKALSVEERAIKVLKENPLIGKTIN